MPEFHAPRLLQIARQMEAGDSVRCESLADVEAMKHAIRKTGGKVAQRKTDGAWRVWKTA